MADSVTTDAGAPAAAEVSETLAAAIGAVAGVASLHAGRLGEIGTYLPGRRIPGIRLGDVAVEIHVVVHDDAHILDTASAVRAAVAGVLGDDDRPIDVTVADLAPRTPGPHLPDPAIPDPVSTGVDIRDKD